jgi:hypothetical protein
MQLARPQSERIFARFDSTNYGLSRSRLNQLRSKILQEMGDAEGQSTILRSSSLNHSIQSISYPLWTLSRVESIFQSFSLVAQSAKAAISLELRNRESEYFVQRLRVE